MLHSLGGDELIGHLLDRRRAAAGHEHFKTIIVIEVDVHGGDNQARMIVLQIGQQFLHVPFVVIVDQRDRTGDSPAPPLLPMLDEMGANHVRDGEGAVLITLFFRHLIELAQ